MVLGYSTAQRIQSIEAATHVSGSLSVHFNPGLPLILSCYASPYGVGAVLAHRMNDGTERPVAFASRSLAPAEKNYSQLDREGLSVIFGVKKFYQYIYGRDSHGPQAIVGFIRGVTCDTNLSVFANSTLIINFSRVPLQVGMQARCR